MPHPCTPVEIPGNKARVEIDGVAVLVTIGPRLEPEAARQIGGDGHRVTYDEGDKEGTRGNHQFHELKPA